MKSNLHEALNADRHQPAALNLTRTGQYPELIQFHDREGGKTYLYVEDYGAREREDVFVSDVCVLDYETGRMAVIPQGDIDPNNLPWEHPRPDSNRLPPA